MKLDIGSSVGDAKLQLPRAYIIWTAASGYIDIVPGTLAESNMFC